MTVLLAEQLWLHGLYSGRNKNFLLQTILTNSGANAAFFSVGTRGFFSSMVKWLGHKTDHPSLSSAEVKNEWSYASATPYAFLECTRTTCHVRFEILTIVNLNFVVFCNVTPCSVVYKNTNILQEASKMST
jgi:hypothetical protein